MSARSCVLRLMTKYMEEVKRELETMRAVGLDVPDRALLLGTYVSHMNGYERGGMGVSECADLLCDLARMA